MNYAHKTQVATYSMIAAQILMDRGRTIGMLATDFYGRSGISQPTWSRIFRGQGRLTLEEMERCAKLVGTKVSQVASEMERVEQVLRANGVKIVDPVSPQHKNDLPEAGKVVIAVAALAFLVSQAMRR